MSGKRRITSTIPSTSLRPPAVEIGARHQIEPLRQGELDLLCGILSPLNAIRLALHATAPLSRAGSKRLFEAGVRFLHGKSGGPEAVYAGMGTRRWHQIAKCMAERASGSSMTIEVERPTFDAVPTVEQVFAWIELSLAAGKPVLLRLAKGVDHFTVAAGITATRVFLFDSTGQSFLKQTSCRGSESFYRIPPKALARIAVSRRG
ncbi:hypothetical protein [Rhizorhabdus histidinilytica]|uniref:hypothetical protein n=1 Tax=Rhizorhabdus histidinilytica TaxID=439228 RepID=UPI001116ED33|nr:hypothetical protein [Rhizorhabdus histidinilytica]